MDAFGMGHWMIMLFYIAVIIVPCWRIVTKAGYSGAWALVALVPLVNVVFLWVFAFVRWPNERPGS
jgi:hypothetical protein